MDAMEISRSGLDVEWRRMEVIARNIANMNTTRTGDGGPYVPVRLISGPDETFESILRRADGTDTGGIGARPVGVRVYGVEQVVGGTREVYEPGHPHANPDGFVTYPEISHAQEMTSLVQTARVYEANLVVLASAQQMYSSALQIGGRR
jgi:flagellar basal-body rod protein FlgC